MLAKDFSSIHESPLQYRGYFDVVKFNLLSCVAGYDATPLPVCRVYLTMRKN